MKLFFEIHQLENKTCYAKQLTGSRRPTFIYPGYSENFIFNLNS